MSCPLLRGSQTQQCRAVGGGPTLVGRDVVAAYCRGHFGACPAYRYVHAAGRLLHPADFQAWVVEGLSPGRIDPPVAPPDAG